VLQRLRLGLEQPKESFRRRYPLAQAAVARPTTDGCPVVAAQWYYISLKETIYG
jgi:hypothetical protein